MAYLGAEQLLVNLRPTFGIDLILQYPHNLLPDILYILVVTPDEDVKDYMRQDVLRNDHVLASDHRQKNSEDPLRVRTRGLGNQVSCPDLEPLPIAVLCGIDRYLNAGF